MIDALAEWVKAYALPGSIWLLLGGTTAALALVTSRRTRRWGQWLMVGLVTSYWLLASPWFAGLLLRGLDGGFRPIQENPGRVDAIVVLGGGAASYELDADQLAVLSEASAKRVLEGARVYHLINPEWVIVSGGSPQAGGPPESRAIAAELVELGIPEEAVIQEFRSGDTYQQAQLLTPLLAETDVRRFVLITSPFHMRRSMAVFREVGWDPLASPSGVPDLIPAKGLAALLPDREALSASELASREYLALIYYWSRGRIESPLGALSGDR